MAQKTIFRILFGAIMLWEVWRYFTNDWIAHYFIEPAFHFTYFGFRWVQPWPGTGMYWHFASTGSPRHSSFSGSPTSSCSSRRGT